MAHCPRISPSTDHGRNLRNTRSAGSFNFVVQASDASSPVQVATQALSITIPTASGLSLLDLGEFRGTLRAGWGADSSVEVGVEFRSDIDGYVTAIRFYKAAGNTGTHVGNLWDATGTRLATATFTGESASGWQQLTWPLLWRSPRERCMSRRIT